MPPGLLLLKFLKGEVVRRMISFNPRQVVVECLFFYDGLRVSQFICLVQKVP
jgi:hypothetical protein